MTEVSYVTSVSKGPDDSFGDVKDGMETKLGREDVVLVLVLVMEGITDGSVSGELGSLSSADGLLGELGGLGVGSLMDGGYSVGVRFGVESDVGELMELCRRFDQRHSCGDWMA